MLRIGRQELLYGSTATGVLALNTHWRTSRRDALDVGAGYFFSGRFVAQSGLDRDMAYLTPTFRLRL